LTNVIYIKKKVLRNLLILMFTKLCKQEKI
jgi:hypothetical protein